MAVEIIQIALRSLNFVATARQEFASAMSLSKLEQQNAVKFQQTIALFIFVGLFVLIPIASGSIKLIESFDTRFNQLQATFGYNKGYIIDSKGKTCLIRAKLLP